MRATKSFFDPFTQRAYTPGETYTALESEHADWLLNRGLIEQIEQQKAPEEQDKPKRRDKGERK